MVSRLLLALAPLCALCAPAIAGELQSTTTPYPGVTHQRYLDATIPARIHLVTVDLSSSEIGLHATAEGQRGRTPSSYAAAVSAQIAVNGDYFSPADFRPAGLAVGDSLVWSGSADDAAAGFVRFWQSGGRYLAAISPPEVVVAAGDLPAGTLGVISGRPMLVRAGVAVTSFDCTDQIAMPCARAPRTAVAVSPGGSVLYLAVVDGWQAASHGMTATELGAFLASAGVHDALMLDGGGASALHIAAEGGVVSSPSDGVARAVANHLAVRYGQLPPGQLVGFIRERSVMNGANISGALVELDDGRTVTTGANGFYEFQNAAPRYTCATASASGYRSATSCRQVISGEDTYNSIPLFPHSDFVDAGPGSPDAGPPADAGPGPDAGSSGADAGGDAGDGDGGDGCSCRTGGPKGGAAGSFFLILCAAALLARSRSRSTP